MLTNSNRRLLKNERSYIERQRELKGKLVASQALAIERLNEITKIGRKLARKTKEASNAAVEALDTELTIQSIKESRTKQKKITDEAVEDIARLQAQVDNLRLTLDERSTYIAEVEETIQRRDTEIALLRMEVETLTLWREKINQQYRTEADIEAAKSHVLQGRNVDQTLENLTRANQKNHR